MRGTKFQGSAEIRITGYSFNMRTLVTKETEYKDTIYQCKNCGARFNKNTIEEYYSIFNPRQDKRSNTKVLMNCIECLSVGTVKPI